MENYFGAVCEPCECVNGQCADGVAGNGTCSCDTGWAGTLCTECAVGWYGDDCSECRFYVDATQVDATPNGLAWETAWPMPLRI